MQGLTELRKPSARADCQTPHTESSGKETPLDLPLPAGSSCEQPSGTASGESLPEGLERIQEAATEGDKLAQVDKG